jgi:hypothetical protein
MMSTPEVEIIFTSHNQGYLLTKMVSIIWPSFIKDLTNNKNQFKNTLKTTLF